MRSQVTGEVTAVHVADGATVQAGQALFTVKQLELAKRIDVTAAEAGEISEIAVVKGQQTAVGEEVAKLTPARYHVLATVEPAQLYRLVNPPTEATVTITGGPVPFACTGVGVQVSEDGTASVRCAIPTDQTVFAGLPVKLDLALGKGDDALVIPVTAVQGGAVTGKAWVDAGDGADPEERGVSLGVNDGTMVQVTEGLAEGDSIRQYDRASQRPSKRTAGRNLPASRCVRAGSMQMPEASREFRSVWWTPTSPSSTERSSWRAAGSATRIPRHSRHPR